MAVEVLLPKLGLTMETGLIEEWLVPPGTPVKPGDMLLRLATDKVDVEVEAEAPGLFHPAVASGVELPPGALIGWLLEAGEEVPSGAASLEAPPPPHLPAETQTPVVGEPGALTRTGRLFASPNARRVARERGVDVAALNGTGPGGRIITADVLDAAAAAPGSAPAGPGPAPTVVSPLVRRDAAAAGVDLGTVMPTGPGGKVLRSDVLAAAAKLAPPAAAAAKLASAAPAAAAAQVIPLTGMRGVIASRRGGVAGPAQGAVAAGRDPGAHDHRPDRPGGRAGPA